MTHIQPRRSFQEGLDRRPDHPHGRGQRRRIRHEITGAARVPLDRSDRPTPRRGDAHCEEPHPGVQIHHLVAFGETRHRSDYLRHQIPVGLEEGSRVPAQRGCSRTGRREGPGAHERRERVGDVRRASQHDPGTRARARDDGEPGHPVNRRNWPQRVIHVDGVPLDDHVQYALVTGEVLGQLHRPGTGGHQCAHMGHKRPDQPFRLRKQLTGARDVAHAVRPLFEKPQPAVAHMKPGAHPIPCLWRGDDPQRGRSQERGRASPASTSSRSTALEIRDADRPGRLCAPQQPATQTGPSAAGSAPTAAGRCRPSARERRAPRPCGS